MSGWSVNITKTQADFSDAIEKRRLHLPHQPHQEEVVCEEMDESICLYGRRLFTGFVESIGYSFLGIETNPEEIRNLLEQAIKAMSSSKYDQASRYRESLTHRLDLVNIYLDDGLVQFEKRLDESSMPTELHMLRDNN